MRKKIDLTGQVFGRLTVLEDAGRTKQSKVLWRCICDCGNTVDVRSSDLIRRKTQSCGCYRREQISERSYKDLTGQKFGRLTVQEDVGRKDGKVLWQCQCDCGRFVLVTSNKLMVRHTQSCGCYNKERTAESNRKNLVGQKFGRLTVLEDVGRTKRQQVIWRCVCDCGNMVDVVSGHLSNQHTKSCGCYNWKGGITSLRQTVRNYTQYKIWRSGIFNRDNFICAHCGIRGGKLHAHHIIFFSTLMRDNHIITLEEAIQCEALWDVSNGITLCKKCHKKEHRRLKGLTT